MTCLKGLDRSGSRWAQVAVHVQLRVRAGSVQFHLNPGNRTTRRFGVRGSCVRIRIRAQELRPFMASLLREGESAEIHATEADNGFDLSLHGTRADDPALILEGPRRNLRLPKILSIEEVERLLAAAQAAI